MPQKPEQVLPQQWTAASADVQGRAVHDHSCRQEKAGRGRAIHYLHHDRRFKRRKGEQQQESGNKLRPDEKRKPHPGQAFGAQLNDRGNEIDRAEKRRRNQKYESDEPQRLAVEKGMKPRALVRNVRQRRIRSPTAFGRAAGNKKASQHDDAADPKRPETGGVHFWKSHVGCADLKRHNKIPEGGERHWHDAEKDHDGAVHGAE